MTAALVSFGRFAVLLVGGLTTRFVGVFGARLCLLFIRLVIRLVIRLIARLVCGLVAGRFERWNVLADDPTERIHQPGAAGSGVTGNAHCGLRTVGVVAGFVKLPARLHRIALLFLVAYN